VTNLSELPRSSIITLLFLIAVFAIVFWVSFSSRFDECWARQLPDDGDGYTMGVSPVPLIMRRSPRENSDELHQWQA
tara:strand:- start:1843 stop:2073 length:231 start_codon:yes stop_codon:yes gene_type:complete